MKVWYCVQSVWIVRTRCECQGAELGFFIKHTQSSHKRARAYMHTSTMPHTYNEYNNDETRNVYITHTNARTQPTSMELRAREWIHFGVFRNFARIYVLH